MTDTAAPDTKRTEREIRSVYFGREDDQQRKIKRGQHILTVAADDEFDTETPVAVRISATDLDACNGPEDCTDDNFVTGTYVDDSNTGEDLKIKIVAPGSASAGTYSVLIEWALTFAVSRTDTQKFEIID